MHVTRDELLQSKVHSNSNPSLNAPSDSLSPHRGLGGKSEDWDLGQISKFPGNRSSMAESKAGHMRLPLSPPHKKVHLYVRPCELCTGFRQSY